MLQRQAASLACALAAVAALAGCSTSHGSKAAPAPTGTPRAIVVSRGASTSGAGCNRKCYFFHIAITGVPAGTYAFECDNVMGSFYTGSLQVSGPGESRDGLCFTQAGYQMPVSFALHGVPSAGTTSTVRSANATW